MGMAMYFVSLVKLLRRDLQKWLKAGTGSTVDQKINGSYMLQCCLSSFPICQVYTQGGDRRALSTNANIQGRPPKNKKV